jgi:hypothetical protein
MNRELPPYASSYRDRHGKLRVRFRKTGLPTHFPKAAPGTEEFWEDYLAWKNVQPVRAGQERAIPGSFDDLITRFYSSVKWKNIPKESTRITYRGELERFRAQYGKRMVATMSARAVNGLMEKMADTPAAANNLLKRLRTLFNYAILLGMRKDNPAKAVDSVKAKGDGFTNGRKRRSPSLRGNTRAARRRGWRWRYSSAPPSGDRTRRLWERIRRSPVM